MAHSSNFIGSDCRLANNISAISCWCFLCTMPILLVGVL